MNIALALVRIALLEKKNLEMEVFLKEILQKCDKILKIVTKKPEILPEDTKSN